MARVIEEDYVSFETAKLLKEKGFNQLTYASFSSDDKETYYGYRMVGNDISRPTLQMAMKWLREKHHLHIEIRITNHSMSDMVNIVKYYWVMTNTETGRWCDESTIYTAKAFDKSEEAEEDAIRHALEKLT